MRLIRTNLRSWVWVRLRPKCLAKVSLSMTHSWLNPNIRVFPATAVTLADLARGQRRHTGLPGRRIRPRLGSRASRNRLPHLDLLREGLAHPGLLGCGNGEGGGKGGSGQTGRRRGERRAARAPLKCTYVHRRVTSQQRSRLPSFRCTECIISRRLPPLILAPLSQECSFAEGRFYRALLAFNNGQLGRLGMAGLRALREQEALTAATTETEARTAGVESERRRLGGGASPTPSTS